MSFNETGIWLLLLLMVQKVYPVLAAELTVILIRSILCTPFSSQRQKRFTLVCLAIQSYFLLCNFLKWKYHVLFLHYSE